MDLKCLGWGFGGYLVGGIGGIIVGYYACLALNTYRHGNVPWYRP
jgi:hypothetical protein